MISCVNDVSFSCQANRHPNKICLTLGLTLTLNIGQDDYMKDIESSAGARIVVHPRGRMPFPKDEGVLAAPGQMSIIGIRQVSYAYSY